MFRIDSDSSIYVQSRRHRRGQTACMRNATDHAIWPDGLPLSTNWNLLIRQSEHRKRFTGRKTTEEEFDLSLIDAALDRCWMSYSLTTERIRSKAVRHKLDDM